MAIDYYARRSVNAVNGCGTAAFIAFECEIPAAAMCTAWTPSKHSYVPLINHPEMSAGELLVEAAGLERQKTGKNI